MPTDAVEPVTATIVQFLRGIGLRVRVGVVPETTFLPGITIERGEIVVDLARLAHPGDLLHEAGHLAVKSAAERSNTEFTAGSDPAEDMMAIAWSWAAARHLCLAPEVVFHDAGYKGGAESLITAFGEGRWIGVPMLQFHGLTAEPRQASRLGRAPYPQMTKWLRDD